MKRHGLLRVIVEKQVNINFVSVWQSRSNGQWICGSTCNLFQNNDFLNQFILENVDERRRKYIPLTNIYGRIKWKWTSFLKNHSFLSGVSCFLYRPNYILTHSTQTRYRHTFFESVKGISLSNVNDIWRLTLGSNKQGHSCDWYILNVIIFLRFQSDLSPQNTPFGHLL